MQFESSVYGPEVARLLSIDGAGLRPMPLAPPQCLALPARAELNRLTARSLFPDSCSPEGALAGMYLYFGCLDEAHKIAQDLGTAEGSFWHGIMHRQEPDPGNAAYWFRRVGTHPVFPALLGDARALGLTPGPQWDPFVFIDFCEAARARPGSGKRGPRSCVQLAEWQLLFDYCARGTAR